MGKFGQKMSFFGNFLTNPWDFHKSAVKFHEIFWPSPLKFSLDPSSRPPPQDFWPGSCMCQLGGRGVSAGGLPYPALQPLPESQDAHCPIFCKPAWLRGPVEFSLPLDLAKIADHWNPLSLASHRDECVPLEHLEFNKVFHLWLFRCHFQKLSCDVLFLALGISDFSTTGIGWGHRVLLLPFWLLHSWAIVAGWVRRASWIVDWFKSFLWIIQKISSSLGDLFVK